MAENKTLYELDSDMRKKATAAYNASHGYAPDYGFAPDRAWIEGWACATAPQQADARDAAPAAQTSPEWEQVRRGLTMVMLGLAGRRDCTESAIEAALDAVTEPGMPLAGLRAMAGVSAPVGPASELIEWEQLPETSSERSMFDRNLKLYGGDPRAAIATALGIWANTPRNGSFGQQCAVMANEVAKLHLAAPAASEQDALSDTALLDAMERNRIAVEPEYEGPWDARVYNDDSSMRFIGSGSTPREAIRAAIAAQAAAQSKG